MILGLMFTTQKTAAVTLDDAVGIWLFNKGQGNIAEDSSKNSNNSTIHGATWGDGKFGSKALDFDGKDDYVQTSLDMSGYSEVTLSAWVYIESYMPIDDSIISQDEGGGDVIHLCVETAGEHGVRFRVKAGGSWSLMDIVDVDEGQWFLFTGVYDGSRLITYINGQEKASVGHSGNLPTITNDATIGAWINYPASPQYFNGTIDEVAIFNVALTDADINSIMNQGLQNVVGAVSPTGKLTTTWASIKSH